jgi:hypothetical protein
VLSEHGCKIASNTYWVARKRPPSQRCVQDAALIKEIQRVYDANMFVYAAKKIRAQLNAEGIVVARCTVERLMRQMGLVGNRRGRAWTVTTDSDHGFARPADLVERDFAAPSPEPAVGRGHHLREDALGMGLRRVRHGRVLPDGRRLASLQVAAVGPRYRRALEMAIWNRQRAGVDLKRTVAATSEGHLDALEWAERWPDRKFTLEDCRHVTRRLEADLLVAGQAVVRVPTRLMAGERRAGRERGKSDPIDALAVARAAQREPDPLVAHLDGKSRELRVLVEHEKTWSGSGPASSAGCAGTSTSCSPASLSRRRRCAGSTSWTT